MFSKNFFAVLLILLSTFIIVSIITINYNATQIYKNTVISYDEHDADLSKVNNHTNKNITTDYITVNNSINKLHNLHHDNNKNHSMIKGLINIGCGNIYIRFMSTTHINCLLHSS